MLPHRLRLLGASDHLSEDSLSTGERVRSSPPSTTGGEEEDDLLYFLRRGPCSSPHIPLGGDSGVFALFCMPICVLKRNSGMRFVPSLVLIHSESVEERMHPLFNAIDHVPCTDLSMVLIFIALRTEAREH